MPCQCFRRQLTLGKQPANGDQTGETAPKTAANLRRFTPEENVNISVYDKVNRSVVNIDTTTNRANSGRLAARKPRKDPALVGCWTWTGILLPTIT